MFFFEKKNQKNVCSFFYAFWARRRRQALAFGSVWLQRLTRMPKSAILSHQHSLLGGKVLAILKQRDIHSGRKRWHIGYCVPVVFLLASCAKSPDMVEPVYVSDVPYQGLSCQQLGADQERLLDADQRLSGEQSVASKDDTIGVLLLGLPIGSMVGEDRTEKLARVRGELEAVQTALRSKDCSAPPNPAPTN